MSAFRKFTNDRSGSIAIIFAFSVLLLGMTVGLAIDYGRTHNTKLRLQNALDAAVLAAAKRMMANGDSSTTAVDEAVKKFFASDQPTNHFSQVISIKGVPVGTDTVRGEAVVTVPMTFMQIAGFEKLEIFTSAEASYGMGEAEIALVLDTTGSMSGAKLDTLKAAAKDLVDTVYAQSEATNKVKFALIPFAQYVNVGLANRNASWMNVPLDYTETKHQCYMTRPIISTTNCRMETRTGTRDGVPYTYDVQVCDYEYGPEEEVCKDYTYTYTWRGCAGSRDYPLNTQDGSYGTRIPGIMNASCPAEIAPLTNEGDTIKASIDAMVASGDTYVPSGLIWGWRSLSSIEPYAQGASTASGSKTRKYIVLMTDGTNTRSTRNMGTNINDHWGSDTADANKITTELCTNIKADGIMIYTIAFEVTDTAIKDILRGCASEGFYDAANSSQLTAAFRDIASNLGDLRISK